MKRTISGWRFGAPALVLAGLLPVALAAAPGPAAGSAHGLGPTSSKAAAEAEAEAKAINLRLTDLPKGQRWSASPQQGNTKATAAAGVAAARCLDKTGAASADPYGTSRRLGGAVLADVLSPQYAPKGGVGLPAANSEVVVVSKPAVADADLAAIAKHAALSCLSAQYLVDTEASGSGKAHVTASFEKAPRHGSGNGGVHISFVEKGGSLPLALYNDEYFYAERNAEIVLSFLDIGTPFSASGAASTVAKVMARAAEKAR